MKRLFIALGLVLLTGTAAAQVPLLRASCPTDILVAAGGGVVFINGDQAQVTTTDDNGFSATIDDIQIDFMIYDGQPSMFYSTGSGANGVCTVTKYIAAWGGSQAGGVDTDLMARLCIGFASEKYNVRPGYVLVHPPFRDHGMYSVFGNADDKNFICTFTGGGEFVAVDDMDY